MKIFYVLLSFLSISLGIVLFWNYYSDPSGGTPSYETLTKIEGEIGWVRKYRYGIRFGFKNDSRKLNYPSKARGLGVVQTALQTSASNTVTVFANLNQSHSPIYSDAVYFDVYEVRVGNSAIRSYDEVSAARSGDQRISIFLGPFLVFSGLYILWAKVVSRSSKATESAE